MEQQQMQAAQPEDEINLLELSMVLVKNMRLIVIITLLAAVVSAGFSLSLPNIYTATAKVIPPQKEGGGLSSALGQLGGLAAVAGMGTGFGGSADLYVSILKSRSVADAVIQKLDLKKEFKAKTADDARSIFARTVLIKPGSKDNVITITADHKNPEMAARLATVTVEELGRRTVQLNFAKVSNERIFLEKRLEVVRTDLKKAEEEFKVFAQSNKAVKVDDQAKASIEGVAKLKAELALKEVQLAAKRSYQTDENPEVTLLMAAVAGLKRELSLQSGSGGGVGEGIPSVGNIPGLAIEYARRMRQVKIQEAILEQLTKQFEMEKINEARDKSTLQILDDAVVPDQKSKPKRSLIVILSAVTAFFCSIFIVFIKEYLAKLSPEDSAVVAEMKGTLKGMVRLRRSADGRD